MADSKEETTPETPELSDDVLDTVAGGTGVHTEMQRDAVKADVVRH